MLEFEQDFFLGETRDNFYIEPMMKSAWAAELEVLDAIAQICNKYNIRWFADWGTLLGAVRHRGFVPWDDDMDICMLRADYKRFLQAASEELPDGLHVLNLYTRDDWPELFTRVVNAMQVTYDEEHLRRFHGCPYMVGIDIFPLDALPKTEAEEDHQKTLIKTLISCSRQYADDPEEIISLLPELENLTGVQFDREKSIYNQLLRAADHVCCKHNKKKPEVVTLMTVNSRRRYHLNYAWYRTTEYLAFENMTLPCPGNYDEVLTVMYKDWRKPVRGRSAHNYPFYNKQKQALQEGLEARIMRGELL